jgi:hypothetical protein
MPEATLYERLGGAFAIAAVVDHFSDAVVRNPIVGQQSENPALREWHTNNLGRLPGLKFMRTLCVGVQRIGRPLRVFRDETGKHSPRLGGGPSRTSDLSRGVRRSRGRAWAQSRLLQCAPAGERRSIGRLRGAQGRGYGGIHGGQGKALSGSSPLPKTKPRPTRPGCPLTAAGVASRAR